MPRHYYTNSLGSLDWRYSVREALKLSSKVLFDNPTATQNLEAFIKQAIAARS
ncbi:MAG: hypothetical protein RM022_029985 [Nostoc sp. EfeVER01]|uniref:hypothetical protein n=1 Tax=unclassified Nostoc TaxID=2593658 RepID=UPI002AD2F0CE|nr:MULTISPECIES: hypothetical protein [unclassified Nostoc]MDZ7943700.1 hypothetical protein [Nostoc sp. EfeVER01]MDZ7991707.1 hypothetical protein [Nostoc sp. EspVER01]